MSNLNFYLTSIEPNIEQYIYSQSIGAYCSLSTLYPSAKLETEIVGLYDTSFYLSYHDEYFDNVEYISINNEVMKVSSFDSHNGFMEIETRGYNDIIEMHIKDNDVFAISNSELLNDVFNDQNSQYRCIAIKNDGNKILRDISIFLAQNSRNINSIIKIAFEVPKSQYIKSTSTERELLKLVDESLIGQFSDDYFSECFLKPEGEIGGIVKSFDSSTGTFLFYDSFSNVLDNKDYEVFPSPSYRLKSGIDFIENNLISSFSDADIENPLTIDNVYLSPNYIIYLWIKREILNEDILFNNNNFVINISYEEGS